jgi:hypothetical protein
MTGTNVVLGPSKAIDMLCVDKASLEILISGTPTGTLTVEGSNAYDPITNVGTFVPLAAGAVNPALPGVAGAGGQTIHNLTAQALGCRWFRLRYVNTSGTGQLNVWFAGVAVS